MSSLRNYDDMNHSTIRKVFLEQQVFMLMIELLFVVVNIPTHLFLMKSLQQPIVAIN